MIINHKMVLLLTSLVFLTACNSSNADEKVYAFLKKTAENANKEYPIQVDSVLKLENIVAFSPATLRYNYTLKFDTTTYDIDAFENSLRMTTLNSIKTSPDASIFKGMLVTLEYNYQDTLGNHLFRFVITPDHYLEKSKSQNK